MHKLLIATKNQGKIQEIRDLLKGVLVEIVTPFQLGMDIKILEDGKTYPENARKKAIAYSGASGLLTVADDSGLEVRLLGGQPGLRSARFSTKPDATDKDRRDYLLQMLHKSPPPWTAQFVCAIALVDPNNGLYFFSGVCSGEIIPEERGTGGFGYDPIFLVAGMGRTMAELSMNEKNEISHRALAVEELKPKLNKILYQRDD